MLTPFRPSASLWIAAVLCISAVVPGCASRRSTAPPLRTLSLGTRQTSYRDYQGYDLCAQDTVRMAGELDGANVLLADFLQSTSAGTDGFWADEHLALLTDGQKALPAPLDVLRKTYQRLRQCRLEPSTGLPEIVRRGEELTRQSSSRLEEAPELLSFGEARRAIGQWEASIPALREQARKERCRAPKRPSKSPSPPVVFFATESFEGGHLWLFCDGTAVRGTAKGSAEILPSKRKPPKRPADPRPYLEAAARFPVADVARSPKLPVRAVRTESADDGFRLDDESVIDP